MNSAARILLTLGIAVFTWFPGGPASAQSEDEKWTAILVGDSWADDAARLYAEQITDEVGVDLFFTVRGTARVDYTTRMMQSGRLDAVKDAKVVVVAIGESNGMPGYCTDTDGEQPFRADLEELPAIIDEFLAGLTELADPETTIIRIVNEVVVPKVKDLSIERGVEDECIQAIQEINAMWAASAEKHGAKVVDVFDAWNGKDGKGQPSSEFYQDNGKRLTDEGSAAIAELLMETGYLPLER